MYRTLILAILTMAGCGTLPEDDESLDPASQSGQDFDLPVTDGSQSANHASLEDVLDQDRDGLTLSQELLYGTDDTMIDSDLDGLGDYGEVMTYLTDPANPDTDHDGLSDFEEVLEYGTDPRSGDSDFDRLTDFDEVFRHGTDPTSLDSDGDGLDDGLEISIGTDPNLVDTDGDGFSDFDELRLNTDPIDPTDPSTFVAGDWFSFLSPTETDALRLMDSAAGLRAGQAGAICNVERSADLSERGVFGGGATEGILCGCGQLAFELAIEGFEEVLLELLDQIGYVMSQADRIEVSDYLHDQFDRSDGCIRINCAWVTTLCAW